ncbi:hypothetical protein J4E90_005307 [Alternaria incomplexa]|uniref:uncharacterized protein n=1 Tax=Alternaria incomplexa TaxID=1187928 RepID=UPI002220F822|nr:uncharacterized protein J4E90_005307 [Alternaria incomplexa]KAI4913588.1 hypothetical protein J4E90_005307 [Alternaria incomplexa]
MTGRTPPAVFNSSPAPIDQDWVDAELIPFLQRVYPEERRTTMDWNRQVVFGRSNLHLLEHYEDFPFTIERLRLCLLNSELLTPAEMSKFISVTEQGSQYCLRIFVRHAIVHGSYMLFSLGDNPSPEFPRAGHTSTRPSTASPAEAAPARATSVAVLEARNATLERELANLQAERGRGNGRGNGRGRGRPSQPRGDFVGRSDRGGRFGQGPNAPPNMQQTPSGFAPNASQGYYPYPNPQYAYGSPYMAAPPMGGYPMQPYQQQPFINPGQQYPSGWTGSQMIREQAAVSQCRSSKSAFRVIKDKLLNVVADLQEVNKAKTRHRLKVFQVVLSNHLQDQVQALMCLAQTRKSSIQQDPTMATTDPGRLIGSETSFSGK